MTKVRLWSGKQFTNLSAVATFKDGNSECFSFPLYTFHTAVFITNLYHLGSWEKKDIKRQVGGKGENF